MSAVLLHNPRCSKSRAALGLLQEAGVEFEVRHYLDEPLSQVELRELLMQLADAGAAVRNKESAYAESGLSAASDIEAISRALAAAPILLERPVFICDGRAVIGRPPERVLELVPPR